MMNNKFWIKRVIGFIFCGLAVGALLGWVVMTLWNTILVPVLLINAINFWQALGIFLLSKILFGGMKSNWSGKNGNPRWGLEMREKWKNMSVEEKEKFKQEWRGKCNSWKKNTNSAADSK